MKIKNDGTYYVRKYTLTENGDANYGQLPGEDVKRMLKGYTYDEEMEMWFSKSGRVGYSVKEV